MTLIPEDTKPDYDVEQTTVYTVTLLALAPFEISDPELAQVYSENGAHVTARKGWE